MLGFCGIVPRTPAKYFDSDLKSSVNHLISRRAMKTYKDSFTGGLLDPLAPIYISLTTTSKVLRLSLANTSEHEYLQCSGLLEGDLKRLK